MSQRKNVKAEKPTQPEVKLVPSKAGTDSSKAKKRVTTRRKIIHHDSVNPTALHKALTRAKSVVFEKEEKLRPLDPLRSLRTIDRRSYEPMSEDTMSLSQSLVDPLSVYRFRLGGYTTLSRTSGVVNSFLASDPSAAGWNSPEWSTLSALFSEFRLVALGVRVIRNYNASIATGVASLAICSNLGTAVNPGSYAACADNADVTFYSYLDTARDSKGEGGIVHVMHASNMNWSQVTTPTVEPYAGAPGSIQFYSDNGLASGTDSNIFQVLLWGIYDFRIRV